MNNSYLLFCFVWVKASSGIRNREEVNFTYPRNYKSHGKLNIRRYLARCTGNDNFSSKTCFEVIIEKSYLIQKSPYSQDGFTNGFKCSGGNRLKGPPTRELQSYRSVSSTRGRGYSGVTYYSGQGLLSGYLLFRAGVTQGLLITQGSDFRFSLFKLFYFLVMQFQGHENK